MKDFAFEVSVSVKTKHLHRIKNTFDYNEYGIADISMKIGNRRISRIHNFMKMGGCSYCFPHGIECINSTASKRRNRNWKLYRMRQWK